MKSFKVFYLEEKRKRRRKRKKRKSIFRPYGWWGWGPGYYGGLPGGGFDSGGGDGGGE